MLWQSPAAAQVLTVPLWHTSFVYDGTTYPIEIVGADPSLGTTTLVSNVIVPIRATFPDGTVLDASGDSLDLIASPIYSAAPFASGLTQYADSVLRAEFWEFAQSSDYHVLLNTPSIEPAVALAIPAGDGSVSVGPLGEKKGVVDFDWFIKTEEPLIIGQLGISPTSLTVFLTKNIRLQQGNASFGGEHYSFDVDGTGIRERFTTVWAGATAGETNSISHEINEWVHDPFNENAVPQWAIPGANDCNKHLEVGDPLVGTLFKIDGYVLQDIAYVDWFSRQVPSAALGGRYDVLGKFTVPSPPCQTGQNNRSAP